MTTSPLAMDPLFRIQVLVENEPGTPTKEFKAGDLAEPTFDALSAHMFANETDPDQYNMTFKYKLEERHSSRWVHFENTEGLGYAIQSNLHQGYVFISASIVKKGTVAPVAPPPPVVSRSTKGMTKTKVAKKTKTVKAKAPSRSNIGPKLPVDQQILTALKELFDLGITMPPRFQVALFTGYGNVRTKSFANAMKQLKTSGFIEYRDKGKVSLTQAGIARAGSVTPPANNEEVHEKIKNLLNETEMKIFVQLVDGRSYAREQLAANLGYSCIRTKSFANSLSKMSSLGFLAYVKDAVNPKRNLVQLTDIAFPLGRPNADCDAGMSIVSNEDVAEF